MQSLSFLTLFLGAAERVGVLPVSIHAVSRFLHFEVYGSSTLLLTDICFDSLPVNNTFALTVEGSSYIDLSFSFALIAF